MALTRSTYAFFPVILVRYVYSIWKDAISASTLGVDWGLPFELLQERMLITANIKVVYKTNVLVSVHRKPREPAGCIEGGR